MFKALLRTRFQSYLNYMSGGKRNKKGAKKRGILYIVLYAYLVICFAVLIGAFFNAVAEPFHKAGLDWLYFAFYGMMSFAIMFILSIFMTQAQMYDAKDNELLLSMPVPSSYILGSRIVALVLENLAYSLVVAVPALYVWLRTVSMDVGSIAAFVVISLLMPFFVFAITGVFSYLLHLVLSRFRNKTIFGVLFAVAFLGLYFYFYTRINTYVQMLAASGQAVADSIAYYARPVYWMGEAMASGNIKYMIFVLLIFVGVFALVYAFLSATFIRSATTKRGAAKVKYKRREMRVSSAKAALMGKEMRKLLSSTTYLLNAGMGLLLLVIGSVYLLIKRSDVKIMLEQLPGIEDLVFPIGALLIAFMISLSLIAPPSISLEGRSIWIPKSMPVKASTVLMAKADIQILLTLPVGLLAWCALVYVVESTPLMMAISAAFIVVFSVFEAVMGVAVNLRFPKLDWINEAQVVKQGASVTICMFGSMLLIIIPAVLYGVFLIDKVEIWLAMTVFTGILAAGAAAIIAYLRSDKAALRFYNL